MGSMLADIAYLKASLLGHTDDLNHPQELARNRQHLSTPEGAGVVNVRFHAFRPEMFQGDFRWVLAQMLAT